MKKTKARETIRFAIANTLTSIEMKKHNDAAHNAVKLMMSWNVQNRSALNWNPTIKYTIVPVIQSKLWVKIQLVPKMTVGMTRRGIKSDRNLEKK
jgi:hypothetical protein